MDPMSVVGTLAHAAMSLYEIAHEVKQNEAECKHLCEYVQTLTKLVEGRHKSDIPPRMYAQLKTLKE